MIHGSGGVIIAKNRTAASTVRNFELQSRDYVQFRTNTLGEGMNPIIPNSYCLNSITDLFQG